MGLFRKIIDEEKAYDFLEEQVEIITSDEAQRTNAMLFEELRNAYPNTFGKSKKTAFSNNLTAIRLSLLESAWNVYRFKKMGPSDMQLVRCLEIFNDCLDAIPKASKYLNLLDEYRESSSSAYQLDRPPQEQITYHLLGNVAGADPGEALDVYAFILQQVYLIYNQTLEELTHVKLVN